MNHTEYTSFVRTRITELRIEKNISEHRMSLDLGKAGSYITHISSGKALPSMHEFFNILNYLDITPAAFFAPCEEDTSHLARLCERLRTVDDETLTRIETLLGWME